METTENNNNKMEKVSRGQMEEEQEEAMSRMVSPLM